MQNILIVLSAHQEGPVEPIAQTLRDAGYRVAGAVLDVARRDAADTLCAVFGGQPPDLLIADLADAADCLPLQHARRLLRHVWGEEFPAPPCLTLVTPEHLDLPDWPAHIDDFLLPPYAPAEALARLKLLLFRHRQIGSSHAVPFADIVLDLSGGFARDSQGETLPLTPREFDLLRFLVTHRGKLFARDQLLDMVWGLDFEGGERTVDIHIRRLRAKLPPQAEALLETRRGLGYGMQNPPTRSRL